MKKLLAVSCIFSIFILSSCGGKDGDSFDDVLKENGLTLKCADKVCSIESKDDYGFSYSKNDDGDVFTFFSVFSDNNLSVMYMIKENSSLVLSKENTCYVPFDDSTSSTCPDELKDFGYKAKDRYNETLSSLGKSENELYEYLKEQYTNSFI